MPGVSGVHQDGADGRGAHYTGTCPYIGVIPNADPEKQRDEGEVEG